MKLFKIILGLIISRASGRQWCLNIGAYFLKKGTGYQIGSIVKEKHLRDNVFRVSVVTGLFYDFQQNKVTHTVEKRILKADEKNG